MKNMESKRILVLGASGMLGNAVLRVFAQNPGFEVIGAARSATVLPLLPSALRSKVVLGTDVENGDSLMRLFTIARPDVVINCIGLVKQLNDATDPLAAIPINSLLPHRLARLCALVGSRLVHVSTDCVFSGNKGMYVENDLADASDLYGRSKLLGEVDYPHAVTLRTSIVGHELNSAHGLVNWFLSQSNEVQGYRGAIFSGLPTVVLAELIMKYVIPDETLFGLYHVSADPINKFELLKLVAECYGKSISIVPDDFVQCDRSLDSNRFRVASGYRPAPWTELIRRMKEFA